MLVFVVKRVSNIINNEKRLRIGKLADFNLKNKVEKVKRSFFTLAQSFYLSARPFDRINSIFAREFQSGILLAKSGLCLIAKASVNGMSTKRSLKSLTVSTHLGAACAAAASMRSISSLLSAYESR